jgi:predicted esterase
MPDRSPTAKDLSRCRSSAVRSLAAALFLLGACESPAPRSSPAQARTATSPGAARAPSAAAASAVDPGPLRIEILADGQRAPTFVMRGGPRGDGLLVFLHGMCGHGLGYAQSFQFSAARKGTLIAPQGDMPCGQGPWSSWSGDVEKLDQRISVAFRALGQREPLTDITLIGYSQGATRAEELARRHPERYTRLISIGAPRAPSAVGLGHLRAALMMAGQYDRQDVMKKGERSLRAAGIPVSFQEIPEATHGAMGPTPEKTMGEALDWLFTSSR